MEWCDIFLTKSKAKAERFYFEGNDDTFQIVRGSDHHYLSVRFVEEPDIDHLVEHKWIDDSVDEIVKFLKDTPLLSKRSIGEYLGGTKPFNSKVLHAFIGSIDFEGMSLVDGIRRLCSYFTFPIEAAQIDPIMRKFAERYYLQNEDILEWENDAYTLSYAIILLNMNMSHADVANRMTKEEFVKENYRRSDQGLLELIGEIYDRIEEQQIVQNYGYTAENALLYWVEDGTKATQWTISNTFTDSGSSE